MILTYDLMRNELMVGDQSLREFYIAARREAGIPISKLEADAGLNHPRLYYLEVPNRSGYRSNASTPMLAALETMGYSLEITG